MNIFVKLFKRYGWTVEQLEDNSFIAYNTSFFVPFSCVPHDCISAVSYLLCDKDPFIESWKRYNKIRSERHPIDIGTYAFKRYFEGDKKFFQFGGLGNHDHCLYEVKWWLERLNERRN